MPWKGTSIMDQRQEFVMKSLKAEKPFRKLCEEYGISEKTGYKWKNRFMEDGTNGLIDMSKRPKNSPTQLREDIIIEIIKIREAHPSWGPKKKQAIIDRNGKHPLPSICGGYYCRSRWLICAAPLVNLCGLSDLFFPEYSDGSVRGGIFKYPVPVGKRTIVRSAAQNATEYSNYRELIDISKKTVVRIEQ